ncbi:MAG: universal stress protein [Thermoleophilaceae bacterium]|nr:universal stress protein [Thermoleophilaceae bacterium]
MYRNVIVAFDGTDEARDAVALAGLLRDPDGVVTELRAPPGGPKALAALVRESGADLFVLGSSSNADPGTILTGPVGRGLLFGCHCPVAVAPRGFRHVAVRPRLVAVAFEDAEQASHGVQEGAPLAQGLGADMRLLCLVPPLASWALHAGVEAGYGHADVERHHQDAYAHVLDHALAAVPRGVEAEGRLVPGTRGTALLDELRKGVDLLVMASPGARPVPGVRPGAAALAVIRSAPCPVLLTTTGVRHTHPGASFAAAG